MKVVMLGIVQRALGESHNILFINPQVKKQIQAMCYSSTGGTTNPQYGMCVFKNNADNLVLKHRIPLFFCIPNFATCPN